MLTMVAMAVAEMGLVIPSITQRTKGLGGFGEGDQQENSHIFFFIVMLKVWDFEGGVQRVQRSERGGRFGNWVLGRGVDTT